MPSTLGQWNVYWSTLYTLISAQTGTGGQLAGVKLVKKVAQPQANEFPNIGIQYMGDERSALGTHERRTISKFLITCSVAVNFNPGTPDIGETALATLLPYMNDGTGNGLEPLLESQPNLAGSLKSEIVRSTMLLLAGSSSGAGLVATVGYEYHITNDIRPF